MYICTYKTYKETIQMNKVLVVDTNRRSLAPCHPARANMLLRKGKASVLRMQPFTIILHRGIPVDEIKTDNLEVKIDPGSRTTGIAINIHGKHGIKNIIAINLHHRGIDIVNELTTRRQLRRSRRSRKTRYRQPRFSNRTRPDGWLPPSIVSRISNIRTWLTRLVKYTGVKYATYEDVKFDTQKLLNPSISGKEYQQGSLEKTNLREYLLTKYNYTCQYCKGKSNNHRLEIEHIIPRSKGGTNSVTNLTLACHSCNSAKANYTLSEWTSIISKQPKTALSKARLSNIPRVIKGKSSPMRDSATMNAIRNHIPIILDSLGIEHTSSYGYITKYNRIQQGYRKDHWIDASLVGDTGVNVYIPKTMKALTVKAVKNNNRQMQLMNKYGFPRTKSKGPSKAYGYSTGDLVKAIVSKGKYLGTYIGKVAIRAIGWFQIDKTVVKYSNCKLLQSKDGYSYSHGSKITSVVTHLVTDKLRDIVGGSYKLLKKEVYGDTVYSTVSYNI